MYTEIIGKVLPTYGDRWSNNTKYEVNTIVYYDTLKASFISKQSSYNQPPALISDYWQLISKDGNGISETALDNKLSLTIQNMTDTQKKQVITNQGLTVSLLKVTYTDNTEEKFNIITKI